MYKETFLCELCVDIIVRIGELVSVGVRDTNREFYSPWMPFGNLLEKKRIIFCE